MDDMFTPDPESMPTRIPVMANMKVYPVLDSFGMTTLATLNDMHAIVVSDAEGREFQVALSRDIVEAVKSMFVTYCEKLDERDESN